MANHLEPPLPGYQSRYQGAALLEMHALAGNWGEFLTMLTEDISYVHAAMDRFCAGDQVDSQIYEHAKALARTVRASDVRQVEARRELRTEDHNPETEMDELTTEISRSM